MRSTMKRGPRTPAVQKLHSRALSEKHFGGAAEMSVPQVNPDLVGFSNEPDNFCRIETSFPSHSPMSLGEGDDTRSGAPQVRFDSGPSGFTHFFQALLARDEFDSACPRTAEALSQLLAARHRLRLNCLSELAESGRFDPLLRQLLAHLQAPLCAALESGSEGCDR